MNTGETIVAKTNKRAVIFVTAKRAKITVTTKEIDGAFHVTKTGDIVETVTSKLPPRKSLLDQVRELSASDRLTLFESFELCCGMNRGSCICEAEVIEIVKPSPTIADEPKDALAAFIAKAQAKKGITPEPITIEAEPVDEWTGWGKEEQTYDDQTGEMRTFRRHIKSGRVKWLDAETWFA